MENCTFTEFNAKIKPGYRFFCTTLLCAAETIERFLQSISYNFVTSFVGPYTNSLRPLVGYYDSIVVGYML